MKKFIIFCLSVLLIAPQFSNAQVLLGGKKFFNTNNAQIPLNLQSTEYIIFQVAEPLNKAMHKSLAQQGIDLLEYIPKNNYLAKVSPNFNPAALAQMGIISWDFYRAEHKLSETVNLLEFPVYALLGNDEVKLDVFAYNNKGLEPLKAQLLSNGFTLIGEAESANGFTIGSDIDDINKLASLSEVFFVDVTAAPPMPENLPGKTSHRSNFIASAHPQLPKYDGRGVNVAMGDDRLIGPHIDYQGRIDQSSTSGNTGDHGDHVAGTIMGAGNLDPFAQGMAPGAFLYVYTVWDAVNDAPFDYFSRDIRITSTSYSNGCNAGYTNFARTADQAIVNSPGLNHVFSAGNNGTSACQGANDYGAGPNWGNVTGGVKVGKNVIAVANLTSSDVAANSSSRGPVHDGRIKPDVSAVGTNVYSTIDVNSYAFKTGTSMSAPGVSGSLAQLYHAFKDIQGYEPDGGLMKAILMNSCDDIGNAGPDFIHGYGRINLRRGLDIIETSQFFTDSVDQGESKNFNITIPNGTQHVDIMVYWTDVPAVSNANRALVNDLNMSVTDAGSNVYLPWVLDPTPNPVNLNTPAVRAVDTLNNTEQVSITQPIPGQFTLTVNGTSVPFGPQKFYVVYQFRDESITLTYPNGGEGFMPNETEIIRWDAFDANGNFTLDYSTDSGNTWINIANNIPSSARQLQWTPPTTLTSKAVIRVSTNTQSDVSDQTFSIVSTPNNIKVDYVCPDSMKISWGNVPGVNQYLVTMLGNQYMDSVAMPNTNFAVLKGLNPSTEKWVSVQAAFADGNLGRRAIAINIPSGTQNCVVDIDAEVTAFVYPKLPKLSACLNDVASNVAVILKNKGVQPISNFDINYRFNSSNAITETFAGTLQPNDSITYTFTNNQDFTSLTGNNTLSVWVSANNDANGFNDSIAMPLEIYSSNDVTVGYTENFESFNSCPNNTNCGATICNLANNWINLDNGFEDDIDWRTFSGSTASNNTGPSVDKNPGTSSGQYLYLEATNCFNREAILLSPCINVPSNTPTEAEFSVHMFGPAMGQLHVDAMINNQYITDLIPALSGDKGNVWTDIKINLSAFAGNKIVLVFRGYTGPDFTSDLAIDNFSIKTVSAAPQADFMASGQEVCPGNIIKLFDNSINAPSNWTWNITPNTFQFVNNTNANSQNPEIELLASGYYKVNLVVSNINGNDSIEKINYLFSDAGAFPPISQNFNATSLPPTGWLIDNPTGSFTWQFRFGVVGKDSTTNTAVFVNNFNGLDGGGEDGLILEALDLTNSIQSFLTFDVSYAPRPGGFDDALRIDFSTDCGQTFFPSGYYKIGSDLATAPVNASLWTPTSPSHWRTDTLDLNAYLGKSLVIKFVNINGNGNALHLDNINVFDFSPPKANFIVQNQLCVNQPVSIEDLSFGYQKNINFNFGSNATPSTANGPGPHQVIYSTQGPHTIQVTVTNPLGADSAQQTIALNTAPNANFGFAADSTGMGFNFWNLSGNFNHVQWFINDSLINGSADSTFVRFNQPTEYLVSLVTTNACGTDTAEQIVRAINIGIDETAAKSDFLVFPNPINQHFVLVNKNQHALNLTLRDVHGKIVSQKETSDLSYRYDAENLAPGVYFLSINFLGGNSVLKITKTF